MLVSAVIPTYNYGAYVVNAVESALSQTGVPMEVVVVDDGSTDDTGERLQRYGERIKYIFQENRGLSAARNTGIRACRGDWVALLDSDDVWHPSKTQVQLDAALRAMPGASVIGSPLASELPDVLDTNPVVRKVGLRSLLFSAKFGPSGALVRRKCFEEIGAFDTQLGPSADRDMWLRLAARYELAQVLSPCWWYRDHSGQMSLNALKMYLDRGRVLDKFFRSNPEMLRHRGAAYAYYYFDAAICYRDAGDRWKAIAFVVRSLCRYPRSFDDEALKKQFLRLKFLARTVCPKRPSRKAGSSQS